MTSADFLVPSNWVLRGTVLLCEDSPQIIENAKIAIELAELIRTHTKNLINVFAFGPDGETPAPANSHGRAVVTVSFGDIPRRSPTDRLMVVGIIVLEEGLAHLMLPKTAGKFISNEPSFNGRNDLTDYGEFDLSDPQFPVTILRQLYRTLGPYIGIEPKYE